MTAKQKQLLTRYADSAAAGAFALQALPGVHQLERRGWVDWKGTTFGTNFYTINDAGKAALAAAQGVPAR